MRTASLFLCLALMACATTGPDALVWVKADGTWIEDDPVLMRQFEVDKTICRGRRVQASMGASRRIPIPGEDPVAAGLADAAAGFSRAADAAVVFEGCMAEQGYVMARRGLYPPS